MTNEKAERSQPAETPPNSTKPSVRRQKPKRREEVSSERLAGYACDKEPELNFEWFELLRKPVRLPLAGFCIGAEAVVVK